jgi:hypothetical protein
MFLFPSAIPFSQNQSPNLALFGQKHKNRTKIALLIHKDILLMINYFLFGMWTLNTASYSQMTPARILAVNSSFNGSQKVTEGKAI